MEIWTRANNEERWANVGSPLRALVGPLGQAAAAVLALLPEPAAELSEATAFIRLARRIMTSSLEVIVASPHPAADWLTPLLDLGLDAFCYAPGASSSDSIPGQELPSLDVIQDLEGRAVRLAHLPGLEALQLHGPRPAAESVARLCPALHQRAEQGMTLSVCGKFHDRRVLGPGWITTWCMDHHQACIFWKGREDESDAGRNS